MSSLMVRVSERLRRLIDRIQEWKETGPASFWVVGAVFLLFLVYSKASTVLLTVNGVYFSDAMVYLFGLHEPLVREGFFWQLVTYATLHGSWWHLGLNVLSLILVGYPLETWVGSKNFLWLLLGGIVGGGIFWLLTVAFEPMLWIGFPFFEARTAYLLEAQSEMLCIGISGGVTGLIGAYAALFPHREVKVFILGVIVRMRAGNLRWLMTVGILIEALFLYRYVAYGAHFGGFWSGWLLGFYLKRRLQK